MKNDFVVKLFEKDEKKVLLKVATALCVGAFILILIENMFFAKAKESFYGYEFFKFIIYLLCIFLENILIVIYLKFKINGEINNFFKLNYILLILIIEFYTSGISTVSLIMNVYICVKTFQKNKKDFWFSLLGIFIIFLTSMSLLFLNTDNNCFKILGLLPGIFVILMYQYIKKINKIPSINYLFLFLVEVHFFIITSFFIFFKNSQLFEVIGSVLLVITIIVNLRVIFPQIKLYTNFNKIQKIILIVGILFSFFTKEYIYQKQRKLENTLEQESNENTTSE